MDSTSSEQRISSARARGALRYVLAAAIVAAAAVFRLGFLQTLGTRATYLTFYPAVMLAALYGGLTPGLLATVFSAILADYFWLEPAGFGIADPADWLSIAIFLTSGTMISCITEGMHRARASAHEAETQAKLAAVRKQDLEALREARDKLEVRVEERTADLFRANRALRESDARLRLFLEEIPAIFWSTDKDLTITASLGKGLSAVKITPGQAVGTQVGQYLQRTGEATGAVRSAHLRALAGESVDYEFQVRGIYFLAHVEPLQGQEGEIAGCIGVALDVTEQTRAQHALLEQSRMLETFFKCTLSSIVVLDRDFNFVRVNDAYARACGRDASQFPGHNHFEFYPSQELEDEFRRVVKTKEPYQVSARPFVFPDHPEWGTTYWDLDVTPLLDGAGEVEYLVFSLQDVTERKRAEDELSELHKEIADLSIREQRRIGQELHDSLGQQLTGIGMLARQLHRKMAAGSLPGAQEAGELDSLIREAQRQTRVLARGLMPVEMDAAGLMTALEELAARTAKTSGISCRFECARPVSVENSDVAVHLFRIAQEAVHNAIRHAESGEVVLSLEVSHGRVILQVRDNGKGMPGGPPSGGLGLRIMRYRAGMIGADLGISSPVGGGTIVECAIERENTYGQKRTEGTPSGQAAQNQNPHRG